MFLLVVSVVSVLLGDFRSMLAFAHGYRYEFN